MISVIIPTYKSPKALNLCIKSAIGGQTEQNEIIVVVDGFYDINRDVLDKWKSFITIVDMQQNMGLCYATNIGVGRANNEKILIINDDNVFPKNWDNKLNKLYHPNLVIAPNQIEPYSSMFRQFHIRDLGRTIESFDLNQYWEYEEKISVDKQDQFGSTMPIFMSRTCFMVVGGWDIHYPSGLVADWDFFLKCDLVGLSFMRTYSCHFYHFVSLTVNNNSDRIQKENLAHNYATQKWKSPIIHNTITNKKFIRQQQ